MGWVGPVFAVLGAVAGVASTVISYRAQQQAAGQAQAMADYNYALQVQQAEVQAQLMRQQADSNAKLMEYQAAIQQRNASMLTAQAATVQKQYAIASEAAAKTGSENVKTQREEARRFLALQRAKIGESGFTGAGSPIEALGHAAGVLELHAQETWRAANVESRRLTDTGEAQAYELREHSKNEGFKAGMTLFQAANERWAGRTAEVQRRLAIYGAEAERLEGYNTARGYKLASYGTLFSGVAQAAGAGYSLYSSSSFSQPKYGGYGGPAQSLSGSSGYSIAKSPYS